MKKLQLDIEAELEYLFAAVLGAWTAEAKLLRGSLPAGPKPKLGRPRLYFALSREQRQAWQDIWNNRFNALVHTKCEFTGMTIMKPEFMAGSTADAAKKYRAACEAAFIAEQSQREETRLAMLAAKSMQAHPQLARAARLSLVSGLAKEALALGLRALLDEANEKSSLSRASDELAPAKKAILRKKRVQ